MTSDLSLEVGPTEGGTICECCGIQSVTAHGFIYQDGDAFAIYYVGWTPGHPERGVTMAIATGDWQEGSDPADRVSIGLSARSTDTEIQFTVLGPSESPWGDTALFGKMLARDESFGHTRLAKTFEIAELLTREDPRIHGALA